MRVLVTGISGFVGRHLAAHLLAEGDAVCGTYAGEAPDLADVDLYPVDILDEEGMAELVGTADPEVIIHLAGLASVGRSWSDPARYFQVNFLGTENLLQAAGERTVLLASSAEVYGAVPEGEQPIPESRPLAPESPYALTKAAAERLVRAAGGVVVRSFNLIGPGQDGGFALPAFARQLAAIAGGAAEPRLTVGNLSARRDFVHVADGVRAFRLLALEGGGGRAYNIASGRAMSIREVLDLLLDQARGQIDGEVRVEVDPARVRPVDVPLLTGDASRLRGLGWEPRHSVADAVADLWNEVRITESRNRAELQSRTELRNRTESRNRDGEPAGRAGEGVC